MKFLYLNFVISLWVTAIATLTIGFFVLVRNPKSTINRTFAFYSFSITWWSFCQIWLIACDKRLTALIWTRIEQVGVFFIPTFFVHFVISLLNIKKRNGFLTFCYSLSVVFAFLCTTRLMMEDAVPKETVKYVKYFATPGFAYHFAILFFVVVTLRGLNWLYKGYESSSGAKKNQLKYLFWSSLFGYFGGAANFFLVYGISLPILNPFGTYALPIYISAVAYAIIKYRLMDIKLALTRTTIFVAVYTVVLGVPFALAVWLKDWLIEEIGAQWWTVPLILMGLLATIGPFFYIYLERRAEDRLLKEQKKYQQSLKQASIGMTRIRNLKKLLELIAHIMTKTVRISYAAIYLLDRENGEYHLEVCRDKGRVPAERISGDSALIYWLLTQRQPIIHEEIRRLVEDTNDEKYRVLEKQVKEIFGTVIIPCFLENKLSAFIVLGDKFSGHMYTSADLDVFQVLASQAALAIENAQFYEEAKEMQAQVAQAEKMATIGTMADGLSHQINNRFYALSLIAGDTIDTIKITDTTKCSPEVKETVTSINRALQRIQANVLQGGEVIKGLLKYTRAGDEGFEALSLDRVIDGTLDMVQYKVKLSDVDIIRDYQKDGLKLKGNLVQLEEVFFNFIDNAYDAIVERKTTLREENYRGRITVSARKKDGNIMEITVEDNGMGIKNDDNKKVFTPFFTTKTSSRMQKGTGLGLYVIRRIITDTHKGKIDFESQHGVGTRFILELPLAL